MNKVFISNTLVLRTRKNSKKYIPSWNSEAKAPQKKTYIYSVFSRIYIKFTKHGVFSLILPLCKLMKKDNKTIANG